MRFDMTAAPVLLTVAVTAAAPVECAVAHVRHTGPTKGVAIYQGLTLHCSKSMSSGTSNDGHLESGRLGGLSLLERQEMPSEHLYPGQLWKHDSAHVIGGGRASEL